MTNGQALPSWIAFNAAEGKFTVTPPPGETGDFVVRVVAKDAEGHEAVTTFHIKVGATGQPQGRPGAGIGPDGRTGAVLPWTRIAGHAHHAAPAGKPGLLAQLKAGSRAGQMESGRSALLEAARRAARG
jgi:hypothetical protein